MSDYAILDTQDERLFKKHLCTGQNISIYPLDANYMYINKSLNNLVLGKAQDDQLVRTKLFNDAVINNYKTCITKINIKYLNLSKAIKFKKYTKQARRQQRYRMTCKITRRLFGFETVYNRRINIDYEIFKRAKRFLELADNNKACTQFIVSAINTPYINNVIYKHLSSKARLRVGYATVDPSYIIPVKYLNEFYEIFEHDYNLIINKLKR